MAWSNAMALIRNISRRDEVKRLMGDEGFVVKRIGEIFYPWTKEGMRETPARRNKQPWDWACLAQRVSPLRGAARIGARGSVWNCSTVFLTSPPRRGRVTPRLGEVDSSRSTVSV